MWPAALLVFGLVTPGGNLVGADELGCTCTGLDYTNGGSYLIDGTSDDDFTFTSVFSACGSDTVEPILLDPDGIGYACSTIAMQETGEQQQSSCPIAYSAMKSGTWSIIIQADGQDFQVMRTFQLTVQNVDKLTVTATPTVVVGVTSTEPAIIVETTLYQTSTYLARAPTISMQCGNNPGSILTETQVIPGPATTLYTEITRTRTEGATTATYVTTVGLNTGVQAREVAKAAAITSTVLQTTYTVTETSTIIVPARTSIETGLKHIVNGISVPPAQTICDEPDIATVTVLSAEPTQTVYDVDYVTFRSQVTVWVGSTQFQTYTNRQSATACWQNGGYYGV
ncbi:hypothetical protein QBC47DRAFT_422042 [Echria macrotheca]|uniref:Uncharacterized protein n=1 Tax=Echria macrotheca TaxID=438768 RepID=A0AAJ0BEV2_9PEZI|nr:hypothetical protein QBC47DRAFT_422042 [Echria macrotheca]